MVRKWSIILFFIILYSCNVAFAAKFTASVERAEVSIDEDLQLNITLSDAILTETINAEFLLKDFYILGNSKLQNGIKNTNFYLSLQPKKVGKITIPAITAITSAGKLTTEAITINVIKSQTIKADKGSVANISIDSYISKENPYKHESITYIAEVVSDKDFQFIPEKLEIKDTIVEAAVPHPSTEVKKGVKYYIYKCKYIITPLKSGKITIPPLKIKGNYYVKNQKKQRNIINSKNLAVFSIIDPQRMFSDVKSIPFALVSNEVTFNVKPPVSGINPWLPAKSLTIKEY
ncbi:MAG: BatD family protein, partial [Rickettsiaceae bacterium]|nr:BatD family protein [Rickettsiaceae bacterium]